MSRLAIVLTFLTLSFLTLACTGTRSTLGTSSMGARVYPLNASQADGLLRQVMEAEFGEGNVHRVARDAMAYEAELRFLIDTDTVTAAARPWKGLDENGQVVDGYVLEVRRSGTYPAKGIGARDRVFERLIAEAEQITPALPQAPR